MSRMPVLALVAATALATPALAATEAEVDALYDAMRLGDLMQLLRDEGMIQAADIRDGMFPERGAGWAAIASGVYNTGAMNDAFRAAFGEALADDDIAPLTAFFTSAVGAQVIDLELSARAALLEPQAEEAAILAYDDLQSDDPDRVDQIEAFVDAGDLIELNVMGGLNASLAFYNGLVDGGAFEMTQDEILSAVWQQEEEIRADATEWLFAYLALAYQPLDDADLDAYVDLSASDAGADLNRALFAGYDAVFNSVSYNLGAAASRFSIGEDI